MSKIIDKSKPKIPGKVFIHVLYNAKGTDKRFNCLLCHNHPTSSSGFVRKIPKLSVAPSTGLTKQTSQFDGRIAVFFEKIKQEKF